MNEASQLISNAASVIGLAGSLYANEAKNLLDKEKYILCMEKYGNYRILVGYEKDFFYSLSAPWGRSFGIWDMIFHLNHLGMRQITKYPFSEFEYFAVEVRPFNKIEKFALMLKNIKSAII